MTAALSDDELRSWAREHLVYECLMLAYAGIWLGNHEDAPRNAESNAHLESFAVHVRCLSEFLWGRRGRHAEDARAEDFCAAGVWERERPERPKVLSEIDERRRLGREIVHLSYDRQGIPPEIKVGQLGSSCLKPRKRSGT